MDKLSDVAKIEPDAFKNDNSNAVIALALEAAANDADGLFVHSALATELAELEETGTLPLVEHQIAPGIPIGLSFQMARMGVEYRKVDDGLYKADTNAIEARIMVDADWSSCERIQPALSAL